MKSADNKLLDAVVILLFLTMLFRLGVATAANIAMISTVIISSSKEKPDAWLRTFMVDQLLALL
jgi:hypothetical protein